MTGTDPNTLPTLARACAAAPTAPTDYCDDGCCVTPTRRRTTGKDAQHRPT